MPFSGIAADVPLQLHHVGFVVAEISASIKGFRAALNAAWDGEVFEDPNQKVKVAFLKTQPAGGQIELVEPAVGGSPVAKFLAERGGGLHHLCYEVDDIENALAVFKSRGAIVVKRPLPAVAFAGRRIAWFLTAEKLLVELLEKSSRPKPDGPLA